MYMRSAHAASSTEQRATGNLKRHINSKLVKACRYSTQLLELLQANESKARTQDIIEAKAHCTSMRGAIDFEKRNWEDCLQSYCLTRVIYSALVDSKKLSKAEPISELLSGTIDPIIRYAAHQLRIPRTTSIDTVVDRFATWRGDPEIQALVEEAAPAKSAVSALPDGKTVDIPQEITWRRRSVPLEDASIAQAIALCRAAEVRLSAFLSDDITSLERRASAYDDVLIAAQDAVDATETGIDELAAEGIPQHDRRMQALQITRTAMIYGLVGWRIGRNRVLCGPRDGALLEPHHFTRSRNKRAKPNSAKAKTSDEQSKPFRPQQETVPRLLRRLRERTVLYDGIIQSFDSVKDLPGVAADSELVSEITAKRSYFEALRNLAIARGHDLLGQDTNALALFARAKELASLTASHPLVENGDQKLSSSSAPNLDVTPGQATALLSLLESLSLRHRALVEMHNIGTEASSNATGVHRPFIESLNEWPRSGQVDLKNLVKYPPVMECIPVKPIYLDLAWNYVQYPGAKEKRVLEKHDEGMVKEEKKSRGWFGFGR